MDNIESFLKYIKEFIKNNNIKNIDDLRSKLFKMGIKSLTNDQILKFCGLKFIDKDNRLISSFCGGTEINLSDLSEPKFNTIQYNMTTISQNNSTHYTDLNKLIKNGTILVVPLNGCGTTIYITNQRKQLKISTRQIFDANKVSSLRNDLTYMQILQKLLNNKYLHFINTLQEGVCYKFILNHHKINPFQDQTNNKLLFVGSFNLTNGKFDLNNPFIDYIEYAINPVKLKILDGANPCKHLLNMARDNLSSYILTNIKTGEQYIIKSTWDKFVDINLHNDYMYGRNIRGIANKCNVSEKIAKCVRVYLNNVEGIIPDDYTILLNHIHGIILKSIMGLCNNTQNNIEDDIKGLYNTFIKNNEVGSFSENELQAHLSNYILDNKFIELYLRIIKNNNIVF